MIGADAIKVVHGQLRPSPTAVYITTYGDRWLLRTWPFSYGPVVTVGTYTSDVTLEQFTEDVAAASAEMLDVVRDWPTGELE